MSKRHKKSMQRSKKQRSQAGGSTVRSAPRSSVSTPVVEPTIFAPPRLHHRWMRIGGVSLAVASAVLLLFYAVLTHTPSWYQVPQIPADREQAIRNSLQFYTNSFGGYLVEGKEFEVKITQREINEWITMRDKIWPGVRDAIPAAWSDPLIRFRPGEITIAARYGAVSGQPLASIKLNVSQDGDGFVGEVGGCRLGAIPVPVGWLTQALQRDRVEFQDKKSRVKIDGTISEGLRMNNEHTWWNGRLEYRVNKIEVGDGEISFRILPLSGPGTRAAADGR